LNKLNPLVAIVRERLEAAQVCDGLELRWDVELARDVVRLGRGQFRSLLIVLGLLRYSFFLFLFLFRFREKFVSVSAQSVIRVLLTAMIDLP
jgi:hypothetical protein